MRVNFAFAILCPLVLDTRAQGGGTEAKDKQPETKPEGKLAFPLQGAIEEQGRRSLGGGPEARRDLPLVSQVHPLRTSPLRRRRVR
jgi:hypothetical protein